MQRIHGLRGGSPHLTRLTGHGVGRMRAGPPTRPCSPRHQCAPAAARRVAELRGVRRPPLASRCSSRSTPAARRSPRRTIACVISMCRLRSVSTNTNSNIKLWGQCQGQAQRNRRGIRRHVFKLARQANTGFRPPRGWKRKLNQTVLGQARHLGVRGYMKLQNCMVRHIRVLLSSHHHFCNTRGSCASARCSTVAGNRPAG